MRDILMVWDKRGKDKLVMWFYPDGINSWRVIYNCFNRQVERVDKGTIIRCLVHEEFISKFMERLRQAVELELMTMSCKIPSGSIYVDDSMNVIVEKSGILGMKRRYVIRDYKDLAGVGFFIECFDSVFSDLANDIYNYAYAGRMYDRRLTEVVRRINEFIDEAYDNDMLLVGFRKYILARKCIEEYFKEKWEAREFDYFIYELAHIYPAVVVTGKWSDLVFSEKVAVGSRVEDILNAIVFD